MNERMNEKQTSGGVSLPMGTLLGNMGGDSLTGDSEGKIKRYILIER